jgi:hypothetical protein
MIPSELKVEKYNILIEIGDEMQRFVEGLDELNRAADAEGLPMIYTADKETRSDENVGNYSILAISKFGLDPSQPGTAVRVAEYTPVDAEGNVIQETHQMVRHASITLQALGIARMQEKRGLKLKAAAMNENAKFKFPTESEKTELLVAGEKLSVKGAVKVVGV